MPGLRLKNKIMLGGGVFGFRTFDGEMRPTPMFRENELGRSVRRRLDRLHAGEVYDHTVGPPWHHFVQKKRAFGVWTLGEMIYEPNLLVTSGILASAQILGEVGAEVGWKWLEIGTGATGETIGDTLLDIPVVTDGMARADVTPTVSVVTGDTLRLDGTFGPNGGSSKAIVEAGDFNIATNNTIDMLARSTFGVKTIDPAGSIQVQYDHLIGA